MDGILYMPYIDFNIKENFDYVDEEFDRDYLNILREDYVKYKFSIDEAMDHMRNHDEYTLMGNFGKKVEESKMEEVRYQYRKALVNMLDVYGQSECIDKLIYYFQTGEMFTTILDFYELEKDPDLETEFKTWGNEAMRINSVKGMSEVEKLKHQPLKDIRMSFGKYSNCVLKNCRFMQYFPVNAYAVLVEKIIFVK